MKIVRWNSLVKKLVELNLFTVKRYHHAYRFEGVIDISINKKAIHNLEDNTWHYFDNDNNALDYILPILINKTENHAILSSPSVRNTGVSK